VIHDDLDQALSSEDTIIPSSGFAATVMDGVRREALIPPPIPFPWRRALPGLALCAGVFVTLFMGNSSRPGYGLAPGWTLEAAKITEAGWIALALLASLVSVTLSMQLYRMTGRWRS
jgi:hypothetical protein